MMREDIYGVGFLSSIMLVKALDSRSAGLTLLSSCCSAADAEGTCSGLSTSISVSGSRSKVAGDPDLALLFTDWVLAVPVLSGARLLRTAAMLSPPDDELDTVSRQNLESIFSTVSRSLLRCFECFFFDFLS